MVGKNNNDFKNFLLWKNNRLNKVVETSEHYSYLRGWNEAIRAYNEDLDQNKYSLNKKAA
jgi:hypothetical protein